jgi:plastocyanin
MLKWYRQIIIKARGNYRTNMKNILTRRTGIICMLLSVLILNSCSSAPKENAPPETDTVKEENKPATHTVEMIKMTFQPGVIKVKRGDRIVFVNHDMLTHDITEESRKAWTSSPLPTDQTWILTVTESSGYYCSLHPVMKGNIIVE